MELRTSEQFVEWSADPHALRGVALVSTTDRPDRIGGSHV
jgi:hypothetical protein